MRACTHAHTHTHTHYIKRDAEWVSVENGEPAKGKALQELRGEKWVLIMEPCEVLGGWRVGKGGGRVAKADMA